MPGAWVAEHGLPALGALPVAVLNRDQFFRPAGPHADHHERAEAVILQADVEVNAIDPDVDIVAVGEAALLERAVLGLPLVGQSRDVGGRQPGGIIPEQGREGLAEVAGGQPSQVEHGQDLGHTFGERRMYGGGGCGW
jgi:hypothetical protein